MQAVINATKMLSRLYGQAANPNILDRITVDYYGTPTPLNQLANISFRG